MRNDDLMGLAQIIMQLLTTRRLSNIDPFHDKAFSCLLLLIAEVYITIKAEKAKQTK